MINTINVIDVGSSDPLNVNQLKSFPATPEGRKAAAALFEEWIRECDSEISEHDLTVCLDETGVFHFGEGYIAMISST